MNMYFPQVNINFDLYCEVCAFLNQLKLGAQAENTHGSNSKANTSTKPTSVVNSHVGVGGSSRLLGDLLES